MTIPPMDLADPKLAKIQRNIAAYEAAIAEGSMTENDLADYLKEQGVDRQGVPVRAGLSPARQEVAARIREDINRREANERTPGEEISRAVVSALDAGTFGLAGLATDALSPGTFRENRDFRREEYGRMSTLDRALSGLAGGLANPVSRVIPGATVAGPTTPLLRIAGRGMLEGAAQGALTGLGETIGSTEGASGATMAGAAFGGLAGGLLAPAGAAFGRAMNPMTRLIPEDLPGAAIPSGTSVPAWRLGEETAQAAARRAAAAEAADRAAGYTIPAVTRGAGMPRPLDVDVAGPAMTAQARSAATSVRGREAFRAPFEERAGAVARTITEGTTDAVALANRLRSQRAQQARVDYDLAVEATKGQPVDSPSLQALQATPTGKAAWEMVVAGRADDLGTGTGNPLPTVDGNVVPDAEAINEMRRILRRWGQAERTQLPAQGAAQLDTGRALKLLDRVSEELPEPFRVANENYARLSRQIDALDMGRKRWAVNPQPSQKADRMAIENVRERMAGMPDAERELVQVGKQFELAQRMNEGSLTPSRAVAKMDNPRSTLAWEMALSGSPLPRRIRAWDDVLARQSDILPPKGPAETSPNRGLLEEARADIAPGAWWTAIKAARNRLSKSARERLEREDEAFAGLLTGEGTVKRATERVSKQEQEARRLAQKIAAQAGRQGGLLMVR